MVEVSLGPGHPYLVVLFGVMLALVIIEKGIDIVKKLRSKKDGDD